MLRHTEVITAKVEPNLELSVDGNINEALK
jgi:hypothetical protein